MESKLHVALYMALCMTIRRKKILNVISNCFLFERMLHPTRRRAEKSAERTLLFQYVVGPGQRTRRLDYLDMWALRTNGAAIVEADDIAEGTGNYPYNVCGGSMAGDTPGTGSYDYNSGSSSPPSPPPPPPIPRPHPNPNGPYDRSPLPCEALGARLVNLQLSRPGDEMTGLPGAPTSLSSGGSPHFVIGNAYVLRVTSDAPGCGVHISTSVSDLSTHDRIY